MENLPSFKSITAINVHFLFIYKLQHQNTQPHPLNVTGASQLQWLGDFGMQRWALYGRSCVCVN